MTPSAEFPENVSRETLERLQKLQELIAKWTPAINLISKASASDVWSRHILDSAQLFDFAPHNARTWADLGSGGGFPGLVVAAIAAEKAPQMQFTLVDSDKRKATFLRQAALQTGLTVTVKADRIETCPPLKADVVSARALASLGVLCSFAHRHLAHDGISLFLKGAKHEQEVEEARKVWKFDLTTAPSRTDPAGVILILKGLHLA